MAESTRGEEDDATAAFGPQELEQLASAMMVLSCVEFGDFDVRIELSLPEYHPLTPLLHNINELIEWLAVAQRQRETHLEELKASQRAALLELSSPLIEVLDGVLCLPIVGAVDEARGAKIAEELLASVSTRGIHKVILEVTALKEVDGAVIAQLLRMIKAVRLLGAECVLAGIRPALAQLIVELGLEIPDVEMYQTLRDATRDERLSGRR